MSNHTSYRPHAVRALITLRPQEIVEGPEVFADPELVAIYTKFLSDLDFTDSHIRRAKRIAEHHSR